MVVTSFLILFWIRFWMFGKKEITFDRIDNCDGPVARNIFSLNQPQKQKIRGTHWIPRERPSWTEILNGYGKAHAHLTAHVTTHHADEACLIHNSPPKRINIEGWYVYTTEENPCQQFFSQFLSAESLAGVPVCAYPLTNGARYSSLISWISFSPSMYAW